VTTAAADDRPDLRAMTLDEAKHFVGGLGLPGFRGEQAWRWVHGKDAQAWDEMTNIGPAVREQLAAAMRIGSLTVAEVQRSRDGTRKLRLTTRDGYAIESVLCPSPPAFRATATRTWRQQPSA
jgi:23S rRNA (adenine2503-C2)-methyltransferase